MYCTSQNLCHFRCQKEDYRNYDYTDNNFTHVPPDFHGDKTELFIQEHNSDIVGSWGPRKANGTLPYPSSTISRNAPLPPIPHDNNTLGYEHPMYNKNDTRDNLL